MNTTTAVNDALGIKNPNRVETSEETASHLEKSSILLASFLTYFAWVSATATWVCGIVASTYFQGSIKFAVVVASIHTGFVYLLVFLYFSYNIRLKISRLK